jgi:hypothetical protein
VFALTITPQFSSYHHIRDIFVFSERQKHKLLGVRSKFSTGWVSHLQQCVGILPLMEFWDIVVHFRQYRHNDKKVKLPKWLP